MAMAEARPVAGPGPATLAAKKTSRSLSYSRGEQPRPVSILRKPSLPSLPTVAIPPVPPMSTSSASSLSPFSTTGAILFPPLPPLPSLPASANVQRKSAPASTESALQPPRVRSTRSRVSFRDEVDVAADKWGTSRPNSHGPTTSSPLVPPMGKRPSADGELGMRRAASRALSSSVPRPALKRASSAAGGPRRREASSSSSDDAFDAFRPQTLRYPRASPALARLSDSSGGSGLSEQWSTSPLRPLTVSPKAVSSSALPTPAAVPSASSAVAPPVPAPQRERSLSSSSSISPATTLATPAKKTRKPRSPIPSWSSTCPSLTSSHRASVASTLTAPSVTSLLLTPHSPHDYPLPTMPPSYLDELGNGSPRAQRDSTDMSDFETFARSLKARQGMDATFAPDGKPRQLQPAARIKPRKSDPVSTLSTLSDGASVSPQVPRASERLLRLQHSLADLRMQRQSSPEKPKKVKRHNSHSSSGSATPDASRASSTPQPPSPTVADLKRSTLSRMGQRVQEEEDAEDSGNESDLDLSLPLLNAALRSHVIPSSSRLLTTRKNRHSKQEASDDEADPLGWGGSDSEEEEFSRTVARIAARKSGVFTTRRLTKRPSLPAGRLNQKPRPPPVSVVSYESTLTVEPPTPVVTERPSTALGTSRTTNATAELLHALGKKYALREELPRPKRFIGGWGAPEVLIDDEWPEAVIEHEEELPTTPNSAHDALPQPLGAQW